VKLLEGAGLWTRSELLGYDGNLVMDPDQRFCILLSIAKYGITIYARAYSHV